MAPLSERAGAAASDPTPYQAYEMQIRGQFGFEDDLAYVAVVNSLPDTTDTDIGVPLTTAESAEMDARRALTPDMAQISDDETNDPTFGGVWISQVGDGVINLNFTEQPSSELLAGLEASLPSGTPVNVSVVKTSLSSLQAVIGSIISNMNEWRAEGVDIQGAGTFVESNSDVISVTSNLATSSTLLLQALGNDSGVTVVEAPVSSVLQSSRNMDTGKAFGGEWTTDQAYDCTIGYSDSHGNNVPTNTFLITAGHCDTPGNTWVQGLGTSPVLGEGGDNGVYRNSSVTNCDCQTVGPLAEGVGSSDVLVNSNAEYHYTTLATNSDYVTGRSVCVSGAHEYEQYGYILCGTITSINYVAADDNNVTLQNAIQTTITRTLPGDSGAPWGDGPTYMGVHFGIPGGYSTFSRSSYISSVTGSTPQF